MSDPILDELAKARTMLRQAEEAVERTLARRRQEMVDQTQQPASGASAWQCRRCHLWWSKGTPACSNCALDRALFLNPEARS